MSGSDLWGVRNWRKKKKMSLKLENLTQSSFESFGSPASSSTKVDLTKYIEESTFNFDNSFGEDSVNEEVYEQVVRPIVYAAFHKAKVTCFAYGQTGSGKTFTMMGDIPKKIPGLYLLATQDLFLLKEQSFPDITVELLSFRLGFPFTKYTAKKLTIFLTNEMDASSEWMAKKTFILLASPKGRSKALKP